MVIKIILNLNLLSRELIMLMVQLLNLIRHMMVNLSVDCDCCSVAEDPLDDGCQNAC